MTVPKAVVLSFITKFIYLFYKSQIYTILSTVSAILFSCLFSFYSFAVGVAPSGIVSQPAGSPDSKVDDDRQDHSQSSGIRVLPFLVIL